MARPSLFWVALLLPACRAETEPALLDPAPDAQTAPAVQLQPAQGAAVPAVPGAIAGGADLPAIAAPWATADAKITADAEQIFAATRSGDLQAIANAPTRLAALGPAALPVVTQQLAAGELPQRRIAALTLLQLGAAAAPAIPALRAAQQDADPHVRAAAFHALKIATGDTSDLDRLRAQHEAAERQNR